MGLMDINYAVRKDEAVITPTNSKKDVILSECWLRSNRLGIMYVMTKICASIRSLVGEHKNVNGLLKFIDQQLKTSHKALDSTLITKFSSLRLTTVKGVYEHIMQMRDIAPQLKTLEVDMSDFFLVHYVLNTLPQAYGPFQISYNTYKDNWSINELLTMCVQEEGRLVMEMAESAYVVTYGKSQRQGKKKEKATIPIQNGAIKKESRRFLYNKKGHIKKDCTKYKVWLEKKGYEKSEEASEK